MRLRILWFKCEEIIPGTVLGLGFLVACFSILIFTYEIEHVPNYQTVCSMSSEADENLQKFREKNHEAFVIGYTGEVGKALVAELAETGAFSKVWLIGRRFVDLDPSIGIEFEQVTVEFDDLDSYAEVFSGVRYGFCCLGSTRAKVGDRGFVKVDHDYVLKSAELAKSKGCKYFSVVSSLGADKNSSILYSRTKGQVEEALKVMHFEQLGIFRPGLLLCDREESRPSESFFKAILKPMSYFFPTAVTTPTNVLARAMIHDAITPNQDQPVKLYENRAIHFLSGISKKCS